MKNVFRLLSLLLCFSLRAAVGLQSPAVQVVVSDFTLDYDPASRAVTLSAHSGATPLSGTSDANGSVVFSPVTPGLYQLNIVGVGLPQFTLRVPNQTGTVQAKNIVISDWTPPTAATYAPASPTLRALGTRLSIVDGALLLDGSPIGGGDTVWTNDATIHPLDPTFPVKFSAPYGGISVGSNTPAAAFGRLFYYLGDVDLGDPATTDISVEVTASSVSGSDVYFQNTADIDLESGQFQTKILHSATDGTNVWDFTVDIGTTTSFPSGPRAKLELTGQAANGDSGNFKADILADAGSAAMVLNTAIAHTSGNLVEVKNKDSAKFSVSHAGAITLAGTTNQIIFGATNSLPADTNAIVTWISVQVTGLTNQFRLPLYQ